MGRFLAGVAASFLMLTGAFLFWQGRGETQSLPPPPPSLAAAPAPSLLAQPAPLKAPEARPKSREEKRFSRADKNKDGRVAAAELFAPRQKAFAKLDKNGNGSLSFEEWGGEDRGEVRRRGQGSVRMADPGRVRHHRSAPIQAPGELFLLTPAAG